MTHPLSAYYDGAAPPLDVAMLWEIDPRRAWRAAPGARGSMWVRGDWLRGRVGRCRRTGGRIALWDHEYVMTMLRDRSPLP